MPARAILSQTKLDQVYQHMVNKLQNGLPAELTYHSVGHTLDVFQQTQLIARKEGVEDPEDLLLLQVGALYHDSGFLKTYDQHEEKSCALACAELPEFGFSQTQIEKICSLILATKVPQVAQTRLQQILCDADLDYLGRDDFFQIAETLFQEFLSYGVVQNEAQWNQLQVRFLEGHRFFTCFSKNNREKKKQKHLALIKAKITQLS